MDIINVENRDPKAKAKQLRRNGIVPCSVYGGTLPNAISIQMTQQTANKMCMRNHEGSRVQLKLDGKDIPAQIKEYTMMFDNRNVEHVSFQALKAGVPVNSQCHIFRKNDEKVRGGIIEQMVDEIPYESLPRFMVDSVTLDLAGCGEGTVITVGDIPELNNENITLHMDKDNIVLRIEEAKMMIDEEETEDSAAEEE